MENGEMSRFSGVPNLFGPARRTPNKLGTPTSQVFLSLLLASLALLLVLGGLASAASTDLPQAIAFDPTVAALISQVTTPTLEYELAGLTGERPVTVAGSLYTITTRYSYQTEAISMATRYAYEQFVGSGLTVTYHYYTWSGYLLRNVVAEKPGVVDPDEIYLITAHLDSRAASWPHDPAPGADDNGSGSIAVLLAARLLAPYRFSHTVRFVLFTGEEQWLRGSDAYATACKDRGENIQGVVNLDMIAYNSDEDWIIDLYDTTSVSASLELTHLFSEVVSVYNLNLVPNRFSDSGPLSASDQWSFLEQGYPAFLAIEDEDDFTPEYHEPTDRLSTLDLDYYADFTRAAIATIVHLGELLPSHGYMSGTVYALDTGRPLAATVVGLGATYHSTFTAQTDASGVYSMPLPVDRYTLTAWSVSPGYYPATITDVLVVTDTTITRDFTLMPWPRLYLPCIVHEG